MNILFKVLASYNILLHLCDFIHVLVFVIVSKCRKSPKLTNRVIRDASCITIHDTLTADNNLSLRLEFVSQNNKFLIIMGMIRYMVDKL